MIFSSVEDLRQSLIDYVGDVSGVDAKGRKRLRIMEEATRQFVVHGYRKTAMGDIAKAVGVAKGTMYLYFETKADLLLAAVAYEKYRTMSLLEGVFAAEITGRERLQRWVFAAISMVIESPLLSRIATEVHEFEHELLQRFSKFNATSMSQHEQFIMELLDAAVYPETWDPVDRREQMVALYSLVRIAPMLRSEQMRLGVPLDRLVETLARVIVEGIRPRTESFPKANTAQSSV